MKKRIQLKFNCQGFGNFAKLEIQNVYEKSPSFWLGDAREFGARARRELKWRLEQHMMRSNAFDFGFAHPRLLCEPFPIFEHGAYFLKYPWCSTYRKTLGNL